MVGGICHRREARESAGGYLTIVTDLQSVQLQLQYEHHKEPGKISLVDFIIYCLQSYCDFVQKCGQGIYLLSSEMTEENDA